MLAEFIERKAAELLSQAGVTAPPVDVEQIAQALNLSVALVRSAPGFSGRLIRERRLIEVNESHHLHRRRFTIGHEIGHYELNHTGVLCRFDGRSWKDPTNENESQAQSFSAHLLMPGDWVRAAWRRCNKYQQVAEEFMVSPEAMWRRLEELDLLGLPPASPGRGRREDWR